MDKKEKDSIDKNAYIENKKNKIFNMNQHLMEIREIIIKEKENLKVIFFVIFYNVFFSKEEKKFLVQQKQILEQKAKQE